jgi:hypothetical protein
MEPSNPQQTINQVIDSYIEDDRRGRIAVISAMVLGPRSWVHVEKPSNLQISLMDSPDWCG